MTRCVAGELTLRRRGYSIVAGAGESSKWKLVVPSHAVLPLSQIDAGGTEQFQRVALFQKLPSCHAGSKPSCATTSSKGE
jgi:hypothetical protein